MAAASSLFASRTLQDFLGDRSSPLPGSTTTFMDTMNQVSSSSSSAPTRPQPHDGRLYPATVHRTYNLASPPIRFPSASASSLPPTPDGAAPSTTPPRPRFVKRDPVGNSPSSSVSSISRSPRPGRCHLPRPSLSEADSPTHRPTGSGRGPPRKSPHLSYETFPIPPPRTPWEERDLPRALGDFLPQSIGHAVLPKSMRSREERKALGFGKDEEQGRPLVRAAATRDGEPSMAVPGPPRVQQEGVPKLTRECFWSEFKCYGPSLASLQSSRRTDTTPRECRKVHPPRRPRLWRLCHCRLAIHHLRSPLTVLHLRSFYRLFRNASTTSFPSLPHNVVHAVQHQTRVHSSRPKERKKQEDVPSFPPASNTCRSSRPLRPERSLLVTDNSNATLVTAGWLVPNQGKSAFKLLAPRSQASGAPRAAESGRTGRERSRDLKRRHARKASS